VSAGPAIERLAAIMGRLRAPDGCPWDREQTLLSLRHYLVEEAQEVLEVMEGQPAAHCEELGDLLFQVVFQSQIRAEQGDFALADVITGIADKLERRHPHVFGTEQADDATAVLTRWEALKRAEGKPHAVSDVAVDWPALLRAHKVSVRAAREGFDWPDAAGPLAKVVEETAEVQAAMALTAGSERAAALHHELGDLLFAATNLARKLGVSPEAALHDATARFTGRVARVTAALAAEGLTPLTAGPDTLDAAWERLKHVGA
jgi:tetrapyrrole methylase family protein/MazG family protein